MFCFAAANTTLTVRVTAFTIKDTTFETIAPADYVAFFLRIFEQCVVPAEQRLHVHCGCNGDISAALVKIVVLFPFWTKHANASILGLLANHYPALVRSLRVVKIQYNDYDESSSLGAFAALATQLRELTFWGCGLTSLQALEGRCEYLRKVDLCSCKQLTNIDVLADRVCLEEVIVPYTAIPSIEPLLSCPNLTTVVLRGCQQLPADVRLPNTVKVIR